MSYFTDWLDNELNKRDWTRADLSRKSGINQSSYSMIYSGQRNPGSEICIAIAHALKLPPETVLREAGILPDLPSLDAVRKEIMDYKFAELTPEQQDNVLAYIEFIQSRDGPPVTYPTKKRKRQGTTPGETVKK